MPRKFKPHWLEQYLKELEGRGIQIGINNVSAIVENLQNDAAEENLFQDGEISMQEADERYDFLKKVQADVSLLHRLNLEVV